jgi:acetyl esterase/lipase
MLSLLAVCCFSLSQTADKGDASQGRSGIVTWEKISGLPAPEADKRISYGDDSLNFGDLRLPRGPGPHPLAVVIHGGCWRSESDLRHASHLSAALTKDGIATWTIEYRRIGDAGGGWPGTFADVARGTDYVRTLASRFPLDLSRVVLVGHSAGGQLALWLAGRRNLPQDSPLVSTDPMRVRGVVALAGITDLRSFSVGSAYCNASVAPLLGGTPDKVPERYAQASPIELVPLGVPQRLLHGSLDRFVPVEQSLGFARRAKEKGDDAEALLIEGAGHFDLIAPFAPAWTRVEQAVISLLSLK